MWAGPRSWNAVGGLSFPWLQIRASGNWLSLIQQLFGFFDAPTGREAARADALAEPGVEIRRSARARRYRLNVKRDGSAVLTIPARGTEREALSFLAEQRPWLERARARVNRLPRSPEVWTVGTRVLFRGEWMSIEPAKAPRPSVSLGSQVFRVKSLEGDLRPTMEAHLKRLARIELTARTWEFSALHRVAIKRVVIRSQRTRWGSCSATGALSLNWRLVQAPAFVADYVILHELMHTRHMNHSGRFWREVGDVCPDWEAAEKWLKANGPLLGL